MPTRQTTWIEFGRKEGETDEEWAKICKDLARALAKATGTEHLLPDAHTGDGQG